MAYTTINKSSLHMNTKLYSGTGSTNAITGVGFQPDLVWIKARDHAYNHHLQDAVRGTGKDLYPDLPDDEYSNANSLTTFGTDGFTVGSDNGVNNGSKIYASWNWKAGGAGSANTDGTIGSHTVSANTTAGFSIVTWTGTGDVRTIGHGLGAVPHCIIIKNRSSGDSWSFGHHKLGTEDWTDKLYLEDSTAVADDNTTWNDTVPTSSVFTVGTSGNVNRNNDVYMAYCFSEKVGFSKFGKYVGNGSSDGTFVYTGFKPAFILLKQTNSTNHWTIYDNKRNTYNAVGKRLHPPVADTETSNTDMDFLSNGFKLRNSGANQNGSSSTYIYMAFAEAPLVGSNNIPCTAR